MLHTKLTLALTNPNIPFITSLGLLSTLITEIIIPSRTLTIQLNKRFCSITTGLVVAYILAKNIK